MLKPLSLRSFTSLYQNQEPDIGAILSSPDSSIAEASLEISLAEKSKTQSEFIDYLKQRKLIDTDSKEDKEFRGFLFDWFQSIKKEKSISTDSIKRSNDLLNIYWMHIKNIWQTTQYLPFKTRTIDDLKIALKKESNFQQTLQTAFTRFDHKKINEFIDKGLVEKNEYGLLIPTLKGAPVFRILITLECTSTNLFTILQTPTEKHPHSSSIDIEDIKIMVEFFNCKTDLKFQNFDLKSSETQYFEVFIKQFIDFIIENDLLDLYRESIETINAEVGLIKSQKKEREAQEFLIKQQLDDQKAFLKTESKERKKIHSRSHVEFLQVTTDFYLNIKNHFSEEIYKLEIKHLQNLATQFSCEVKQIHFDRISKKTNIFFLKKLEEIKKLELEKHQKTQEDKTPTLKPTEIKTLEKPRFEYPHDYFNRKSHYGMFTELPLNVKLLLTGNSESKSRNSLEKDSINGINQLFFLKSLHLLTLNEKRKREEIELASNLIVTRVHTPYKNEFPLKIKNR